MKNLIECIDAVDGESLGLLSTNAEPSDIENLFTAYKNKWVENDTNFEYLSVDEFCEFLEENNIVAERVYVEQIVG